MGAYDIETFLNEDNKMIPYCVCFYINNKTYSYYYNESYNIILKSIESIFYIMKNENYFCFYIHEINFDGILILEALSSTKIYQIETFLKKMNIYSLIIIYKDKKIEFKCSYKIIPSSLKNISKSFNLLEKLPFPYKFSKYNNLFYIGIVCESKFFNSEEDYNDFINSEYYKSNIFNFKEYSIIYCKRDTIITYEAIKNILTIINKLSLNIPLKNVYSAPSLSIKIFIKKFNNNKIKIKQNNLLDRIIRPSYFGGRCEIYGNPYDGEHIFHFDFKGMYAQCMNEKFCFGKIKYVYNNIDVNKPGFYYIKAFSKNLNIPVLPHHNCINNKLMFTNGEVSGIY